MKLEYFPSIIEVQDPNDKYFSEKSKLIGHETYRELIPTSGYTVTIKNETDFEDLVKNSNLFDFIDTDNYFEQWSYYLPKLPIYLEANFTDILFEDPKEFVDKFGTRTVFGIMNRLYHSKFSSLGSMDFPYRLFVYEDYDLGDYKNDSCKY